MFSQVDFKFYSLDVIDGRTKISSRLNTKTPFKLGLEKTITDPIFSTARHGSGTGSFAGCAVSQT